MKEITFTSNFGNFDYALRATVDEKTLLVLAGKGLGQIAQRTPCSNAEVDLAGASWPKNKKGDPKRPEGFQRTSIAYSAQAAAILKGHLEVFKNRDGIAIEDLEVSVSEHFATEAESKWAAEKALIAGKNGDVARLVKLATKVGYEIESDDEAEIATELVAENVAFCQAIRAFQKALLAEAMAD
jgi:hypothetical protein